MLRSDWLSYYYTICYSSLVAKRAGFGNQTMAAESRFASLSCFVLIFLTNWLDFTKTIIPLALMSSESIAHSAFCLIGY